MAQLFAPEWLDELKSRCDIVDIISRYVPLKRNGREYSGCCPFHHEKTPSFFVYPGTMSYHCFGCKESGDLISFLRKYENLGFVEAVEKLANIANMPMPELKDSDAEEIARKKAERKEILSALKDSARYYFDNLRLDHPQAQIAREYLKKRQIDQKSIVRFGLGCSLDYDSSLRYLREKGYSLEILKKAGLASETNGKAYDSFARRLMFPLINKDGEVIGFSARLLENKDVAKYKNTSATPVFNKSEVVFAINLLQKLRNERRDNNADYNGFENIIIVEGQIDVITMHHFGITNTIACLGTALTPMHARKLKQFSENVILLLDGDSAGHKATLRSIDVLRGQAINVRVARLPDGYDPDEFLHKFGAEELQKILDDAIDGIEYKIRVLRENYDLTEPAQRTKFVHECLIVLKGLNSASEQDIYLPLVHKFSGTPVDVLRLDLNDIDEHDKPFYERDAEPEPLTETKKEATVKFDGYGKADLFILASILYQKEYTHDFDYSGLYFTDAGLKQAYEYATATKNAGGAPNISGLYSYLDVDSSTPLVKALVAYEFLPDSFPELTFKSCVLKNKERALRAHKKEVEDEIIATTDKDERNEKMREALALTKELEDLKKEIDKVDFEYAQKRKLYNKN